MNTATLVAVALALVMVIAPVWALRARRHADARDRTTWALAIFAGLVQLLVIAIAAAFVLGVIAGAVGTIIGDDPPLREWLELGTLIVTSFAKVFRGEPMRDIELWTLVQMGALLGTLVWAPVWARHTPHPLD